MYRKHSWQIIFFLSFSTACQRAPEAGIAADPHSIAAPAPMGSETNNITFKEQRLELKKMLAGELSGASLQRAIGKFLPQQKLETLNSIDKKMVEAKFYFGERRFISASLLLSEILDENPVYPRARNLLARCFYFLGNLKRALDEFDYIVMHQGNNFEEVLDALYLQGAAVYDSSDKTQALAERAIRAWKTYLNLAKKSPHAKKVKEGLAELAAFISGKPQKLAQQPQTESHFAFHLFESGDLLKAEHELKKLLKSQPKNTEAMTYLGRVFVRTGRVGEAFDILQKASTQKPLYLPSIHYLGMAYMMKQDPLNASKMWQRVVDLDPDYANQFNLKDRIVMANALLSQKELK